MLSANNEGARRSCREAILLFAPPRRSPIAVDVSDIPPSRPRSVTCRQRSQGWRRSRWIRRSACLRDLDPKRLWVRSSRSAPRSGPLTSLSWWWRSRRRGSCRRRVEPAARQHCGSQRQSRSPTGVGSAIGAAVTRPPQPTRCSRFTIPSSTATVPDDGSCAEELRPSRRRCR